MENNSNNKWYSKFEYKKEVKQKKDSPKENIKNFSKIPNKEKAFYFNNKTLSESKNFLEKLPELFSVKKLPEDAKKILLDFNKILNSAHPLNSKQKVLLPQQIRELSHYLTDERGQRRKGYMNQTTTLSAYVYYFLWWNLIRLTKLFSNLPEDYFSFDKNKTCLDLGSGPLTIPIALFLARPELRKVPLTWYCLDISQTALSYGENIFLTVAAALKCEAWKIIRVKGELGSEIKEKAALITCGNMFNELNEEPNTPPDYLAKKYSEKILSYSDTKYQKAKILIIEPGVPKSARLISLMRDAFLRKSFKIISPCTHNNSCPMDGKKGGKWCNYCFNTDDAPGELRKLSEKAYLPKERAVLSFIALEKTTDEVQSNAESKFLSFRINSDPIHLPYNKIGYYACSEIGLLLIISQAQFYSGECLKIKRPDFPLKTDEKSGALIIEL